MDNNLIQYILGIADNSLILGQRLGELCGHGPSLETDIALTNISLDLLGQTRSYYQYVADMQGEGATEDTIAFLRLEREYKNALLVEQPNTDFGYVIARQFLFDVYHLALLQELQQKPEANFIFSSSCTVYGQAEKMPITEDASIQTAMSPYGNTKQIGEEIITDTAKVTSINAILLRYFNPIGAHPSTEIGELPIGVPQNLVPFITQTGFGLRQELSVYGDDYPTPDGTAVRDYIHVVDLAKAHVIALQRLLNKKNTTKVETFNLGTGTGSSVLEVIHTFEKVSGKKLPYKIVARREGDITSAYANTDKANNVLGWKAESTLDEAMASAWKWEQKVRS